MRADVWLRLRWLTCLSLRVFGVFQHHSKCPTSSGSDRDPPTHPSPSDQRYDWSLPRLGFVAWRPPTESSHRKARTSLAPWFGSEKQLSSRLEDETGIWSTCVSKDPGGPGGTSGQLFERDTNSCFVSSPPSGGFGRWNALTKERSWSSNVSDRKNPLRA